MNPDKTKQIEDITQIIAAYDDIIYSDDSEFSRFLEKYRFEEVFRNIITPRFGNTQDSKVLGLVIPIAKFLLAQYLLAYNISNLLRILEECEATQSMKLPFRIEEVPGAFTIEEVFKMMKELDDQYLRRILINLDDARFSDLYKSVRSSDFESFNRLMDGKSTVHYSKLVANEVFRFDMLSEKIVNDEELYSDVLPPMVDWGFAIFPNVTEGMAMLNKIYDWDSKNFVSEKCTAFLDIYPIGMSEIYWMIVSIQSLDQFSALEKKALLDVSSRYSFLFEDVDTSLYGQAPDNSEVIKRKASTLGMAIHEKILDGLNSDYERNDVASHVLKFDNSKIREFISSNFRFDNKKDEEYFNNNYLANISSYISSIRSFKDFHVLCYLFYPFHSKQKKGKDEVTTHLFGALHWIEEPKDKEDCAHRLYKVCCPETKSKLGNGYDDFNNHPQNKLRRYIHKEAQKDDCKWMERFIYDYWPREARMRLLDCGNKKSK